MSRGWIGVDLDGTIAHYEGWKGPAHIGPPVLAMVERVKAWLAEGIEVRIFTARVSTRDAQELMAVHEAIELWTYTHCGQRLHATCTKDYAMVELWDDRAVQVVPNTGRRADVASTLSEEDTAAVVRILREGRMTLDRKELDMMQRLTGGAV